MSDSSRILEADLLLCFEPDYIELMSPWPWILFLPVACSYLVPEEFFFTRFAVAALTDQGSVRTWGYLEAADSSSVESELGSNVITVVSNPSAFAALKSDGSLVVWGPATSGADTSAVSVALSSGVMKVVASYKTFAVLKSDGSVFQWYPLYEGSGDHTVFADVQGDSSDVFSLLSFALSF